MNTHRLPAIPAAPRRTATLLAALSATLIVSALLAGCGDGTTGGDPTARVPKAPEDTSAPSRRDDSDSRQDYINR